MRPSPPGRPVIPGSPYSPRDGAGVLIVNSTARPFHSTTEGKLSRQRAEELTKIKVDLQNKFQEALKAIDAKIESEGREEADDYATVGKCAADLAKQTDSTADGILALRCFPRQGGPRPQ